MQIITWIAIMVCGLLIPATFWSLLNTNTANTSEYAFSALTIISSLATIILLLWTPSQVNSIGWRVAIAIGGTLLTLLLFQGVKLFQNIL